MRLEIAVVSRDISEDMRNVKKTHLGCLYCLSKDHGNSRFKYIINILASNKESNSQPVPAQMMDYLSIYTIEDARKRYNVSAINKYYSIQFRHLYTRQLMNFTLGARTATIIKYMNEQRKN